MNLGGFGEFGENYRGLILALRKHGLLTNDKVPKTTIAGFADKARRYHTHGRMLSLSETVRVSGGQNAREIRLTDRRLPAIVPEMTYKVSSGTLNLCSLTYSRPL